MKEGALLWLLNALRIHTSYVIQTFITVSLSLKELVQVFDMSSYYFNQLKTPSAFITTTMPKSNTLSIMSHKKADTYFFEICNYYPTFFLELTLYHV